MTKKKIVILAISIIVIIVLSFLGGRAYAKYMSKVTGKGTVDIANWNFKINEREDNIQTISLNPTINNNTISKQKIAPGTSGDFQIKLDATGTDVGINYTVRFENETKKPTNLKFIYNEKIYNTISELGEVLSGTINADDEERIKIFTIKWDWPYETGNTKEEIEQNDKEDTKDAKEIGNYKFDVTIFATQLMPEK